MSLSQNLQNILDETLNSLLFVDVSLNLHEIQPILWNQWNNAISSSSYQNINQNPFSRREVEVEVQVEVQEETKSETGDSLPDLIPVEEERAQAPEQASNQSVYLEDSRRRIRLWSNLLLDYHSQITTYQSNIRTILNITETMLPNYHPNPNRNQNPNQNRNVSSTRPRPRPDFHPGNSDMTLNNRFLQLLNTPRYLANPSTNRAVPTLLETLVLEPIYTSRTESTTPLQIGRATTSFTYNPQNELVTTVCPITLEEFVEGETLTQIRGCGHVFKIEPLYRWFERNHRCPSCRYDITTTE